MKPSRERMIKDIRHFDNIIKDGDPDYYDRDEIFEYPRTYDDYSDDELSTLWLDLGLDIPH